MMFGFGHALTPYLAMLERQREEERRRRFGREPSTVGELKADRGDRGGGFLLPRQYGGEAVSGDVARQARANALVAFGVPLLANAASGDWGGALAQGVSGFQGAMTDTLERERQIAREREADALRQAAEDRRQQHEDEYFTHQRDELTLRRDVEARKAREAEEEVRREAADQLAERERRRELVRLVAKRDPALAAQLDALVESDKFPYGEAVAPTRVEREPRQPDVRVIDGRIWREQPDGSYRPVDGPSGSSSGASNSDIRIRTNELLQSWQNDPLSMADSASFEEREKKRAEFRRQAEQELTADKGGAEENFIAPDTARRQIDTLLGGAGGPIPEEVKRQVQADLAAGEDPVDILRDLMTDLGNWRRR